ncbi:MAG: ArsI/CadI family heavy metal resistance metalloenzyme [Sulfuricaulis sp.]
MKRFHVHVAVDNLPESIRFYSVLFGIEPMVIKTDYAKWMLDDPRINFAISTRGHAAGLNHLGFQVESNDELRAMRSNLEAADSGLVEQTGTACCYAKSDKYWVTDPSGIAWETFHSLGTVPVYGADTTAKAKDGAYCIPVKTSDVDQPHAGCCVPSNDMANENNATACCG